MNHSQIPFHKNNNDPMFILDENNRVVARVVPETNNLHSYATGAQVDQAIANRDFIIESCCRYDALKTSTDKMKKALEAVLESISEPCYYDHHGLCQAHTLQTVDGKPECEMQLVRDALCVK